MKLKYIKEYKDFKVEVQDLLQTYVKGRRFFDALDDVIKNSDEYILKLVEGCEDKNIVSTGGFGDLLYESYQRGDFKCKDIAIFNGKICTENKGIYCVYPEGVDLDNKEYVFIDDSLHSGGTLDKIEEYLNDRGSYITDVRVAYDGSLYKDDRVKSLYRYFEEHPEKIK
jgi:hypothetical protein